jgi:hypothetical protein
MSYHTIKLGCGHTEKTQVHHRKAAERDSKIEWLKQNGECIACKAAAFAQKQEAENRAAAYKSEQMGLPALIGSDKQIAWAESLRHEMLSSLKSAQDKMVNTPKLEAKVTGLEVVAEAINRVQGETSAKWFIGARDKSSVEAAVPDGLDRIKAAILAERQPAIEQANVEIDQAQADLDQLQVEHDAIVASTQIEYDQLQAVADSWSDEQVDGDWTDQMLLNAVRREEIMASWRKDELSNARQKLRCLKSNLARLLDA